MARRKQLKLRRQGAFATAHGAGQLIGRAVRRRFFSDGGRTRSKNGTAPAPITGESDYRGLYRRKSMPARRRRRWVKFVRKVRSVVDRGLGPNFNVRVTNGTLACPANGQGMSMLHTVCGSAGSDPHTNDLKFLANLMVTFYPQTGPGPVASPNNYTLRYIVSGYMVETMITNLETYPVFVDMYYWRSKKDVPVAIGDIVSVWGNSLIDLRQNQVVSATVDSLTMDDYGVTPFQGTQFAKTIRVYKKTRVKLAGGSCTQVETRAARDIVVNYGYAEHYSMLRGITNGILFVGYGTPDAASAIARAANLAIVTNKNYTWRAIWDSRQQGMNQHG